MRVCVSNVAIRDILDSSARARSVNVRATFNKLTMPANELDGDDRFSYSGIDLDLQRQTWHHCFQLVNGRHRRGLAAGPLLVSHWPKRRDELRAMSMAMP